MLFNQALQRSLGDTFNTTCIVKDSIIIPPFLHSWQSAGRSLLDSVSVCIPSIKIKPGKIFSSTGDVILPHSMSKNLPDPVK
jgi:hypothetical protein